MINKYYLSILILLLSVIIFYTFYYINLSKEKIPVNNTIPKYIWFYWDNENPNHIIKLCIDITRKLNPKYNIYYVNDNNVESFITDKEVLDILSNKNILKAQKSDLIRLYLLYTYGGIYVDASVIVLHSFDWIYKIDDDDSLFVYKANTHTTDNNKPVLESWFLACKPGNHFIRDAKYLLTYILKDYNNVDGYTQLLKNDKEVNYQKFINHSSYHIIYFIFIYIQYKSKDKYKFHLLNCNNYREVCKYLMTNKDPNILFNQELTQHNFDTLLADNKMIKLASYNRNSLKSLIPVKNSLIDRLIKN